MFKVGTCAALFVLAAAVATAGIQGYGVTFIADHNQISEADPAPSDFFFFNSILYAENPGEISAGTMTFPGGASEPMIFSPDTLLVYYSSIYPSQAALFGAYPSGSYTLDVTAGSVAPQTGTLVMPDTEFPLEIPRLNPGDYTNLQNAPANADMTIGWPKFSYLGGLPIQVINFTSIDRTDAIYNYGDFGNNGDNFGATIPAAQMRSGHRYFYYLEYEAYSQHTLGMGGAAGSMAVLRRTLGYYNVKADPGTIAGYVTLNESVRRQGEMITITVKDSLGNIEDHSRVLGYDGYYAFDTALTGNVSVYFQGRHWLSTVITDVDTSVGQDDINPVLRNGDCDGNNLVNTDDYLILNDHFDTILGDAGYDLRADLDDNYYINTDDYLILSGNFDESGEELP